MTVRFFIDTRGCPKNTVDSEALEQALRSAGHTAVSHPHSADVVIVNTCGFIDVAKQESIDRLIELGRDKRPGQRLVAAGCLSQRYPEEVSADLPEVDVAVGVDAWRTLPELLDTGNPAAIPVEPVPSGSLLRFPASLSVLNQWPASPRKVRGPSAYIKISEGCNYGCTFCAIPIMKGLYRSKPLLQIIAEAKQLAHFGVRELILVSQDSTAYGLDRKDGTSLATLLEELAGNVPDLKWVRVMYLHPDRLTPRLIERIAAVPSFCQYVDIPLQHAHPDVLKRMRRGHLIERTEEHIALFRQLIPHVAVRTAFIVGFPGETRAEFDFLVEWTEKMRFDRMGVFTYSKEEGTPGAVMSDQVPEITKERRRKRLMETQAHISLEIHTRLIGQTLTVLVEGVEEDSRYRHRQGTSVDLWSVGRSHRDAPEVDGTVFLRGRHSVGDVLTVRITDVTAHDLFGEVV
ncbi:MAG: 30S ribosomal protein S12 methylthiotransferase RimO [Chloroflexi bacterium]|nr:30S ribosomal protein S12 methylthiotransferase RimO [Chloroflexota bacterium]